MGAFAPPLHDASYGPGGDIKLSLRCGVCVLKPTFSQWCSGFFYFFLQCCIIQKPLNVPPLQRQVLRQDIYLENSFLQEIYSCDLAKKSMKNSKDKTPAKCLQVLKVFTNL